MPNKMISHMGLFINPQLLLGLRSVSLCIVTVKAGHRFIFSVIRLIFSVGTKLSKKSVVNLHSYEVIHFLVSFWCLSCTYSSTVLVKVFAIFS